MRVISDWGQGSDSVRSGGWAARVGRPGPDAGLGGAGRVARFGARVRRPGSDTWLGGAGWVGTVRGARFGGRVYSTLGRLARIEVCSAGCAWFGGGAMRVDLSRPAVGWTARIRLLGAGGAVGSTTSGWSSGVRPDGSVARTRVRARMLQCDSASATRPARLGLVIRGPAGRRGSVCGRLWRFGRRSSGLWAVRWSAGWPGPSTALGACGTVPNGVVRPVDRPIGGPDGSDPGTARVLVAAGGSDYGSFGGRSDGRIHAGALVARSGVEQFGLWAGGAPGAAWGGFGSIGQ